MKFLAVFVTLAAVACGLPQPTTWTPHQVSNALQSPVLIPYLQTALNEFMNSLHRGPIKDTITVGLPVVAEYTLNELSEALQNPNTNPAQIPHLEAALNQLMESHHAGIDKPSITVVLPPVTADTPAEPGFIDVWPIQTPGEEPSFIDVWPIQNPEPVPSSPVGPASPVDPASPVAPAQPAPAAPSSPLVQIIVNVQNQQSSEDSSVVSEIIERPTPVQVENPLPAWGNFI